MGVKTTHYISKKEAKKYILNKLNTMSKERLADVLEASMESPFYNFYVVSSKELEEQAKDGYNFIIRSAEELPD